jgi:hypothetical protein
MEPNYVRLLLTSSCIEQLNRPSRVCFANDVVALKPDPSFVPRYLHRDSVGSRGGKHLARDRI